MKKYVCVIISIIVSIVSLIILFSYNDNKEQIIIRIDKNKQVNMEKYMWNVVCSEIGEYYDYEAVKAFCVVVRTNIIYSLVEKKGNITENKLINKGCMDMPYIESDYGKIINGKKIAKAINDTKGEVCLYKNRIVYLPYHKVSSGRTINKQANNGEIIPYLKTANCFEDIENKDYLKMYYYDMSEDKEELKENITKQFNSSYITYKMDEVDNRLRVVTQGTGHNYGMSLYNSYVMSRKGYTYREILNKFYKNICIAKVYE